MPGVRFTAGRPVAAGAFSLLLCACGRDHPPGPRPYPVKGWVRVNGEPARGAEVSFRFLGDAQGVAVNPTGRCGDDGDFDLTTYAAHDGAPAGDYQVSIT